VTSSRIRVRYHFLNNELALYTTTTRMTIPPFETTFAVPMTCEACIKDIKGSLDQVAGMRLRKVKVL
jgi:hypothetical protein